jgi:hypothetical protein
MPLLGTAAVTPRARRSLAAWSSALVAPTVWATSIQGGQLLPYVDCARGHSWTAVAALTATVLALLAGGLCWTNRPFDRPGRFACAIASLLAMVLAFATLLQTIASIMLTGCER